MYIQFWVQEVQNVGGFLQKLQSIFFVRKYSYIMQIFSSKTCAFYAKDMFVTVLGRRFLLVHSMAVHPNGTHVATGQLAGQLPESTVSALPLFHLNVLTNNNHELPTVNLLPLCT